MAVLTIRDVPDHLKAVLAQEARARGQSLQAFLLSVLTRQAAFARNQELLREIERDISSGGGAESDAPDAATVLDQARAARRRSEKSRGGAA
jgi:hypothetical protein